MFFFPLPFFPARGQHQKMLVGMAEEHFESRAEFIQSCGKAILRTTASAESQPYAIPAFPGKTGFPEAELRLLGRIEHIDQPIFLDVSQIVVFFNKKVTGIHSAVVFYDHINAALLKERAFRRLQLQIEMEQGIEKPDRSPGDSRPEIGKPEIKQTDKEITVLIRGNGIGCPPAGLSGIGFAAGDELHVVQADGFEKGIDLFGKKNGIIIDKGQGVHFHTFGEEEFRDLFHTGPGTGTVGETSVSVVNVPGTVDGQSDQKFVRSEKAGPVFIEEQTVCLEGIAHRLSLSVLLLEGDHSFKKRFSQKSRFPSLPGERNGPPALGERLPDGLFQNLAAHAVRGGARKKSGFFPVETVGAEHIAVRSGRFHQNRAQGFHFF
jgi:hypothetical protein